MFTISYYFNGSLVFVIELRITEPELRDDLKVISEFGDKVALKCDYFDSTIYFTLDGSNPKYFLSDAQVKYFPFEDTIA